MDHYEVSTEQVMLDPNFDTSMTYGDYFNKYPCFKIFEVSQYPVGIFLELPAILQDMIISTFLGEDLEDLLE